MPDSPNVNLTLTGNEWWALGLDRDPEAREWAKGLPRYVMEVAITGEGTYELRTAAVDTERGRYRNEQMIMYNSLPGHRFSDGREILTRRRCYSGTVPRVVLEAMARKLVDHGPETL